MTDADLAAMNAKLKENTSIRVLDLSSNTDLDATTTISCLQDMMSVNRTIEYLGLSKLNLTSEAARPIFDSIGRFPFPEDQVADQQAALKARDAIIEKNKKLKASKKPEEPVPQVDTIEQITRVTEAGEEVEEWVTVKNPQLRHLNLCMNKIDDELERELASIIERTPEDFTMTLSANMITEDVVGRLHNKISALHRAAVDKQVAAAEAAGETENLPSADTSIHLRRLAV